MVTTRRSRAGLATMPLDVISGVVQAASPHQTAAAAALSATCPALRDVIMSYCTDAADMRHFGRSQQIAPLLRRLTGAQGHHAPMSVFDDCLHSLRHSHITASKCSCRCATSDFCGLWVGCDSVAGPHATAAPSTAHPAVSFAS